VDRPEENQYYLDLYGELAQLRPKRLWTGAGGLAAVNYRDGRRILERAAESGLCSIAAGLESISAQGQKQSGAWRKLHYTSPDSFDLQKLKENVRTSRVWGSRWRLLRRRVGRRHGRDVSPDPGVLRRMRHHAVHLYAHAHARQSALSEYLEQGGSMPIARGTTTAPGRSLYRHPTMSAQEMFDRNAEVMTTGYSARRILKRTMHAVRNRPSLDAAKDSFFTQLGVRKAYRQLYAQGLKPSLT